MGRGSQAPLPAAGAVPLPPRRARNAAIRPGGMTSCARAGGAAAAAGRWGAGTGHRARAGGRAEALRPGCGRRDVRGLDPEKVSGPAVISLDHAERGFPLG